MDITSTRDGGVTVLGIVGRIDFATSKDVEHAATAAIEAGCQRMVFDMRHVDYVSSAGLRAILMAAKKANAAGGGAAIFGLQPGVEEVFAIAGFGKIVPIASSDSDARELLGA